MSFKFSKFKALKINNKEQLFKYYLIGKVELFKSI